MKEAIKAVNTALLNLTWWKKPILVILYPVLLVVTYLLWRGVEQAVKSEADSLNEEKTDD